MINRAYFFHLELQSSKAPKFISGVVWNKSWFPNAERVWEEVYRKAQDEWKCSRDEIRCLGFNRV